MSNQQDSGSGTAASGVAIEQAGLGATPEEPRKASHDIALPERLAEFMRTGWADTSKVGLQPVAGAPYFAERRARLSAMFPGEALLIPTGNPKVRNDDVDYEFRPSSDFFWLTGYHEPDAVVVLLPTEDGSGGHEAVLYARPRSSRETDEFFASRDGELWVGRRPDLAENQAQLGLACRDLAELDKLLAELRGGRFRMLRALDASVEKRLETEDQSNSDSSEKTSAEDQEARSQQGDERPDQAQLDAELASALSDLRLVKDDWEIAQLESAIAATIEGFADIVRAMPADREVSERLIDGVFGLRARHDGNYVGYGTIAAAGAHACTLHWTHNDGRVRPGELLLLDGGVETTEFYTADITRTLPISGRFSEIQRRVYELVLAAQEAGMAAVRPGADWLDMHNACMTVLAEGLARWGLLPVPAEESLRSDVGLHRRWTLHSAGHMLGLDVHDCSRAKLEAYRRGTMQVGQVLTVEPGLYFQPDDTTVPPEYRGIGVRIEDDVVVTEDGCRNLSAALPRTVADVEAWMAEQRAAGIRYPG